MAVTPAAAVQTQAKPKATTPSKPKTSSPIAQPQKQKSPRPNHALTTLAKELEKSIAQIQTSTPEKSAPPVRKIAKLQIDAPEEKQSDYVASLTRYLHTALHLPDFGQVKMQLTVRQDGTIVKLLVIKAESEENRKYLEKHIPLLHFPPLQGEYAKDNTHTFVLAFCNEL